MSDVPSDNSATPATEAGLSQRVAELQQQERSLRQEIDALRATYNQMLQTQIAETQVAMGRVIQESLTELEERRKTLQLTVEQLERRQERIRNEMKTTFAGSSQDLAIRVQGFKDYLVGSLQDLVTAAEQLKLTPAPEAGAAAPATAKEAKDAKPGKQTPTPGFAETTFRDEAQDIRDLIDRYRTQPDYYGPPWQLRRTFEPVHAERVSNWFFEQGGRGAIRTMNSRLQNILIASAVISVLNDLYGDQLRALILANSPERLGEWRRGLQDCLGISRTDFGPEQGITLFETAEAVIQKADRLLKQNDLPLIIVDESEDTISLSLLQFPLWLAFAADPQSSNFSLR